MKVNKGKSERKLLNQLKKGKRWCKVVGALACLVVFCTVYALILPAVTMDKTTDDRQEETSQEASGAVSEEGIMTLQAEGEDYQVTVTCDEGAGIPEGAVLEVTEYAEDSDEYKACFEKANSALIYTDGSCVHKARFFDISIMDGDVKIEPQNAVNVKISQNADITENTENLLVIHETDTGTDVISEVELIQEENGYVTASFETESFSDYGTISAGQSVKMGIGDTVTLTGSSGNRNNWSVSPDGYVTIKTSGTNAVITGTAAGTVTITHTYTNKGASESFTVIITDTGGAGDSDEESLEKESEQQGYTVTVKGNKKILQDAELFVEEIEAENNTDYYSKMVSDINSNLSTSVVDQDSVFDFLKMYHIYLSKDGGETEYDPTADETLNDANINLQVTIAYDTAPEGWPSANGNLYVGHYKKNGDAIENKGFTDVNGIKQIKVSGNSVTFHIKSFSVITTGALAYSDDSSSITQDGVDLNCISGTLNSDDVEGYDSTGANNWQVSTVGTYQSVNGTRVAKYIEPTNIEDVFKVTIAVERSGADADLQKILEAMPGFIINENKNSVDSPVGTIIEPKEYQNGDCYGSTDETEALNANDYFFINYQYTVTEDGKTVTKELGKVKMYRAYGNSSGQNHGIIAILPNGKWIVIDTSNFKWNDHGTHDVVLSQEQYEALLDAVTPQISVRGVTDYLDTDRFIYIGTEAIDSKITSNVVPTVSLSETTATVPDSDGQISWSGEGWQSLNSTDTATMSYYVRLKTETIDAMEFNDNPVTNTGTAYGLADQKTKAEITAQQAIIEGDTIVQKQTDCIAEVSQPAVKGLLYYIKLQKIEKDSDPVKGLANAEFAVYSESDTSGEPITTITTDENGYGLSGALPWGKYILIETKVPQGYKIPDNPTVGTYSLAYTGDSKSGWMHEVVNENKPGVNLVGNVAIENESLTDIPVKLIKIGMENGNADDSQMQTLGGAQFKLYKVEDGKKTEITADKLLKSSSETGIFSVEDMRLEDGTYILAEEKAPDGYYKIVNELSFIIDTSKENPSEVITTTSSSSNINISYEKSKEDDETIYTIHVINRTGVELPATGGTGTLPYTLGGAGLVLASVLMYGYSMRRKRERRSR